MSFWKYKLEKYKICNNCKALILSEKLFQCPICDTILPIPNDFFKKKRGALYLIFDGRRLKRSDKIRKYSRFSIILFIFSIAFLIGMILSVIIFLGIL